MILNLLPRKMKKTKRTLTAKSGRTSMKFFTALRLSLNNLMTKKGRTILYVYLLEYWNYRNCVDSFNFKWCAKLY